MELKRPGEGDVAVKVPLVKFIEENRGDGTQLWILNELAQQNSFGDEADPGAVGSDVFEANLVADFVTEPAVALGRDTGGEQAGREPARLEDHDLTVAKQSMIEEDLRDLGRFSRAGRRLDDETGLFFKLCDNPMFKLKNGQILASHRRERLTSSSLLQRYRGRPSNSLVDRDVMARL